MTETKNNLFGTNQRFRDAVGLINEIPSEKFYPFLSRIVQKLDVKVTDICLIHIVEFPERICF
jgi:hypothetical protein